MADKPNIVVFVADQWRWDHTGVFGHPVVKTPHFDKLATENTGFSHAFTTNPICGPSRCSLITGWYPHTRGHRSQDYLIDADEPNLFKYLKSAGYHIAWGGKDDMLTKRAAAECVDTRILPTSANVTWHKNPFAVDDPRSYSGLYGPVVGKYEEHSDVQVVRQAQEFMRRPPKEPYCLFINVTFPHPPYSAPEPYASMYKPADMTEPISVKYDGLPAYMWQLNELRGFAHADPELVKQIRAVYCGMVTMADQLLGDVMQTLDETGQADKTALFCLADHGDYTGDYGLCEKWFTACHDVILRVPIAARLPGVKGRGITDALIQHIDVMTTILDLAGVKPTHTQFGKSLASLIRGEVKELRDAVFADGGANIGYDTCIVERSNIRQSTKPGNFYYPNAVMFDQHAESASRTMMVRTDRWKYVWRQKDVHELYDVQADPQETKNLLTRPTPEALAIQQQLQARLLTWCAETGDILMPPQNA